MSYYDRPGAYGPACEHSPSANPRMAGICVKCGRPFSELAAVPLPDTGADPARDPAFEADFMADVTTAAQQIAGISNAPYSTRVNRRLDIGRERYGDGDFLSKDCMVEVLEETPDLAAYAMLELQRQVALGIDPDRFNAAYLDLVAVAAYGAVADFYAQRASLVLRGMA